MFMSDSKKKSPAAMIIASMSKNAPQAPEASEAPEADEGKKSAGEELVSAIQSGDAMAVMDALKAAMDLLDSDDAPAAE